MIARAGTAASVVEPGIAADVEAGMVAEAVLEIVSHLGIAAEAEAGIAADAEAGIAAEAVLEIAAAEVEIAAVEVGKMLGKTAEAGILAEGPAEAEKLVIVQTAQTGQIRQSLEFFQIEALAVAVGPSGSQRIQTPGSAADATGQHCQLDQRQTECRSWLLKTGSKLFLSWAAAGQRQ